MTLVDTSVWIGVFRRQAPLQLEQLVPFDEVVTAEAPRVIVELDGAGDSGLYVPPRALAQALQGIVRNAQQAFSSPSGSSSVPAGVHASPDGATPVLARCLR